MEDLSRYNGEGTALRKAQLRMLDMLIAFDDICRANDIPYWLDYGTLLGAVRHKGFIPWDDDVDVCVLEKDKDRLRECLLRDLPDRFALQDTSVDPHAFFSYTRIRDKKSYCYYPNFVKLKEQGLWLDIFYYSVVASPSVWRFTDAIYRRTYREIHLFGDVGYSSRLKRLFNRTAGYVLHPISLLVKALSAFVGNRKNPKLYGAYFSSDHVFPHDTIFPLTEVEFEGRKFFAPSDTDAHLKELYKDYMRIPDESGRKQILDVDKIIFYE